MEAIAALVAVCLAAFAGHVGVLVGLGDRTDPQVVVGDVPTIPAASELRCAFLFESDADEVARSVLFAARVVLGLQQDAERDVDVDSRAAESDAVCWRKGQDNHLHS